MFSFVLGTPSGQDARGEPKFCSHPGVQELLRGSGASLLVLRLSLHPSGVELLSASGFETSDKERRRVWGALQTTSAALGVRVLNHGMECSQEILQGSGMTPFATVVSAGVAGKLVDMRSRRV